MTELQIMMSCMSEEQKQRIMDKADRLEVFFKDDVLYMKDKDELAQIVKENRQAMNDLWKERYGTDLEMNFYEGDE